MKKTNIIYWIFTAIIGGFMLFSSVGDVLVLPDAVTFMTHLGYPAYFLPFIGWAKVLGVIAILVPGFQRLKEWAYAGLFFDLLGAAYSLTAVDGLNGGIVFMAVAIGFLFTSYLFHHKRLAFRLANPSA